MLKVIVKLNLVLLIACCSSGTWAQDRSSTFTPELNRGKVFMSNGEIVEGALKVYDELRIAVVVGDGTHVYLTPSDVTKFSIYDWDEMRDRTFVTLPYTAYKKDATELYFFEVLSELNSFAVLSKMERTRTQLEDQRTIRLDNSYGSSNDRTIAQTDQTIVFMDNDGKMEPYLEIIYTISQGLFDDKQKCRARYLNKSLMKKFTGAHHPALMKYADDQKLSFKSATDLPKILEFYRELKSAESSVE